MKGGSTITAAVRELTLPYLHPRVRRRDAQHRQNLCCATVAAQFIGARLYATPRLQLAPRCWWVLPACCRCCADVAGAVLCVTPPRCMLHAAWMVAAVAWRCTSSTAGGLVGLHECFACHHRRTGGTARASAQPPLLTCPLAARIQTLQPCNLMCRQWRRSSCEAPTSSLAQTWWGRQKPETYTCLGPLPSAEQLQYAAGWAAGPPCVQPHLRGMLGAACAMYAVLHKAGAAGDVQPVVALCCLPTLQGFSPLAMALSSLATSKGDRCAHMFQRWYSPEWLLTPRWLSNAV